ncbi:hypothetical protein PRJ39_06635 [Lysobacter enzymogenes]
MPLSIRRAKARATALLDALEVGATWNAHSERRRGTLAKTQVVVLRFR